MDCRRCGAPLHEGVVICPECGARQRRRSAAVRCASCGKSVAVGLQVCPHCGRNVRPAGPRWGLWLAGVIALALFSLWALDRLPIQRMVWEFIAFRDRVSGLVQVLGPVVSSPSLVPSEAEATPALVALLPESPMSEPGPTPTATPAPPTPTPEPLAGSEETTAGETPAAEPSATLAVVEGVEPTGPTVTVTADATERPALTPTATPSPTLRPPTATPSPTVRPPTATPSQAGGRVTYRVQAGDTLSTIAERYGITWQELAAANGLNAQSVLRIGQELIIPLPGGTLPPTATPTSRLRPTATPVQPTATPLLQFAAPVVKDPGDGASYSGGDAFVELSWQSVSGMGPADQYQIVVTWVEQGAPMEHRWFTTATGTRVPPWLWGKADQPARKYTWTVQVVRVTTDGKGGELVIPLSPPSPPRVFYWG